MLENKNIVITGANRGIGLATLKCCVQNGANVFACVRSLTDENKKLFSDVAAENKKNVYPIELNLCDDESIKNASKIILDYKLSINGLVNNAGVIGNKKLFSMTTMQEIRGVFNANFFGPLCFTQRIVKNMIRNKSGSVVNIASVAALDGGPGELEYCSSKAAVIGASKKLSRELGAYGIRVNSVAPGVADTGMASVMNEGLRNSTIAGSVLKRLATPQEIAETIVWLLSDKSSFVTGQTIRVDGGM